MINSKPDNVCQFLTTIFCRAEYKKKIIFFSLKLYYIIIIKSQAFVFKDVF